MLRKPIGRNQVIVVAYEVGIHFYHARVIS
jgi:hypothetical protein